MTTIQHWITIIGVSAAMAGFPLTLAAAVSTDKECVQGKPTADSYTWDFHREATNLFKDVQVDSVRVMNHAARLNTFSGYYDPVWQSDQLSPLRSEVNDMGEKLCRLQTIRRLVEPWQQKEIDQIATSVQLLADNTQDAIEFVNAHPHDLWNSTYQLYLNNLYSEANNLARSAEGAIKYARVLREYRQLNKELGVAPNAS